MEKQRGFTLIELMVVIGIIAILSAIGIPAYQNYLRKAALTDVLQTFLPYRTAIELCAIDRGGISNCDAGTNGIPAPKTTRYLSEMKLLNPHGQRESECVKGYADTAMERYAGNRKLAAAVQYRK